ncbi:MAG: methyltransferase [Hyphomicrobiales bacterium]|nr:methyltransferase [Hyphomicrobiales bacterium]
MKVIDLFCGPGGMSTSFEQAGFEIIEAFDKDKWAVETFSANHKANAKQADLGEFDFSQLSDCDVIV